MFDTDAEYDGWKNFETKYVWDNFFSNESELKLAFEHNYEGKDNFDNMEQIQKQDLFDALWSEDELCHDLATRYCENVDFKAIADRLTYMYLKQKGQLSE
jgi:hypothetical protein